MKKLFILILTLCLLVLVSTSLMAAVGTCTQTLTYTNPSNVNAVRTLTFVCTASADDASYPSTAVSTDNMSQLLGWALISGSSLNGGTGPTASTVITLTTTTEGDILGGAGKTPAAATAALANKFKPYVDSGILVPGFVPITGNLTLVMTGNLVNSAVTTIVLKFIKL